MTEHEFYIKVKEMVDNPPYYLSQSAPYAKGYRDAYLNAYANIKELADEVTNCDITFRFVLYENEKELGCFLDKYGNRHLIKKAVSRKETSQCSVSS